MADDVEQLRRQMIELAAHVQNGQVMMTLTLVQMLHRRGALDAGAVRDALLETVAQPELPANRPDVAVLSQLAAELDRWLRGVSLPGLQ